MNSQDDFNVLFLETKRLHINLAIVITGPFKASNKPLSLAAPSSDRSTVQQPFKSHYIKSPNVHINI